MRLIHFAVAAIVSLFAPDVSDKVIKNFKEGNAAELSQNFSSSVELSILGAEETYSKTQAEMIMKDFFAKNKPSNFVTTSKGGNDKATKYINGKLETSSGIFKVYILMKNNSGVFLITELRLE